MKIIRWLLSHSLFILLIVAVIYAYMFWGNLLGEDTPAGKAVAYLSTEFVEVEEFVNAIKAKQAELSEEQLSAQHSSKPDMDETANTSDTDKAPQHTGSVEPESIEPKSIEPEPVEAESIAAEEVVVEARTEVASNPVESQPVIEKPVIEQQPVSISLNQDEKPQNVTPQKETPVKQNSAAIIASKEEVKQVNDSALADSRKVSTVQNTPPAPVVADKAAAIAVTHSDTEETFVSAAVAKQLDNVDENGEVIDASQPGGAVRENWITARKLFYQRKYELSEQTYQQVIDNTKNNYDAYGELGNVYFNQGKNKQAASAYFEAAAILVSKGRINRARSLMGLLRHLDKSKASELQQLIDSTKS